MNQLAFYLQQKSREATIGVYFLSRLSDWKSEGTIRLSGYVGLFLLDLKALNATMTCCFLVFGGSSHVLAGSLNYLLI
jgi:hypothetical protein